MNTWTEADFDRTSWHDCHVHGIAIAGGEHGCGELTLDIDFITRWDKDTDGSFLFHVAPATLVFHDIFGLVIDLDYARVSFGMTPFSLIEREADDNPLVTQFAYRLPINCPEGSIRFLGHRFTMTLRSQPIVQHGQWLEPAQRGLRNGSAGTDTLP